MARRGVISFISIVGITTMDQEFDDLLDKVVLFAAITFGGSILGALVYLALAN